MSNFIDVSSEQLCYIPCSFCHIVLAVGVPCSSLMETVTVRCGHCGNLWSVNMATAAAAAAAAFHGGLSSYPYSPSLPSSFLWQDPPLPQANNYNSPMTHKADIAMGSSSSSRYYSNKIGSRTASVNSVAHSTDERVVNRPPEKRQRVPSAYNQFIKEEIQRIKANNPDISHREAFSTAAKNWAHFPHIHFGLMLETKNQPKHNEGYDKHLQTRTALLNN
ncbi:hypothetical protein V2J09_002870 [Rumex salicifolius]